MIAEKVQQSKDVSSVPPAIDLWFFSSLWLLQKLIHVKYAESEIKHPCERSEMGFTESVQFDLTGFCRLFASGHCLSV